MIWSCLRGRQGLPQEAALRRVRQKRAGAHKRDFKVGWKGLSDILLAWVLPLPPDFGLLKMTKGRWQSGGEARHGSKGVKHLLISHANNVAWVL